VGPGIRISHMAKLTADPGQARYGEPDRVQYFERVLEEARRLPGVETVAATSAMPLFSFNFDSIAPDGFRLAEDQKGLSVWSNAVDEHYFDALEIPLVRGRVFNASDDAGSQRVAVVNQTLAAHVWPGADPIGKRFRFANGRARSVEVVGVVRNSALALPGEVPQDAMYLPFRQERPARMTILATTSGPSTALLAPLRNVVTTIDADVPVSDVQTMEQFYEARISTLGRTVMRLIGAMGVVGVGLTMIGLYGLVSYGVSRRTREIGIRIAIGATSSHIVTMVLRQGLQPAWIGLTVGLPLTFVTSRWLSSMNPFTYEFSASEYAISAPVMLGVALLAAWIPARRAAGVQPTVALRCD